MMNFYLVLRFLHIAGAILFTGGVFARQLVRSQLRLVSERSAFAGLARAARLIDERMVMPGSSLVVVIGLFLAIMTRTPVLGFIQGGAKSWLLVSNLLIVLDILLVVRVFLPVRRQIDAWLAQAPEGEAVPPGLLAFSNGRRLQLAYLTEQISLLIIIALMVFKPF
jgi:hypothetical protein